MKTSTSSIRMAVDIGGTFTDLVIETPRGQFATKVLTTSHAPERAVVNGVGRLLAEVGVAPQELSLMMHGTTLATNAIIERKGAHTALISTQGFRDILDIADEGRYDQYDIHLEKPAPLVPRALRFTVPERVSVAGDVLLALDEGALRAVISTLLEKQVTSVAVGFLHGYRNPVHEKRVAAILAETAPQLMVTLASEACPEIREYERLSTACANAYVQPLMARYLHQLGDDLRELGLECPVLLMTSGGGLTTLETAARFPIRLVESGPAAGAIMACDVARRSSLDQVISFDMGGTTAKICIIKHARAQSARTFEVDRAARFIKGSGLPLRIPVIEMVEIGAGGGSIARLDELNQIAIGPDSAGSEPGPVCYDRGGRQPTITDADLCLGRIDAQNFAGGTMVLCKQAAADALADRVGTPLGISPEMAAYGVAEMVDETMSNAARVHAVEKGQVAGEHTLVAFGGAAPLHACRMAEKLGVKRIVVPHNAGVGSAVGLLRAPIAYEVVRSRYLRLQDFDAAVVNELFDELYREAHAVVTAANPSGDIEQIRLVYMRYIGQGHEIDIVVPNRSFSNVDVEVFKEAFDHAYAAKYARTIPDADIEILTWALTLTTPSDSIAPPLATPTHTAREQPGCRRAFDPATNAFVDVTVVKRDNLDTTTTVCGPAIIVENDTSTFVSSTFEATLDDQHAIVLSRRVHDE